MKETLIKLAKLLSPYRISLLIVLIFCIGATAFNIAGPKILGNITTVIADDYIKVMVYDKVMNNLPNEMNLPKGTTGKIILESLDKKEVSKIPENQRKIIEDMTFDKRPEFRFKTIKKIIIILISIYVFSAILSYFSGLIMIKLSQKITYKLRRDISEKVNKLPLNYFDLHQHGDTLSRITNDVDTLSQNLNQNLNQAVMCFTSVIGILIMMFIISPVMTVIAILILPLSFIFIGIIMKKSQKYFTENQKYLADINGHVEEMYSGHNIIKVFNKEEDAINRFDEINDKLYKVGWKSQFISGLMFPIINFVGNIGYVAVCVLGGSLVVNGQIKIGDIQSFI